MTRTRLGAIALVILLCGRLTPLAAPSVHRALGIRLGDLAKLSTFDLSNEVVKRKMSERYGSKVPMNEPVISPARMFASPLLETVR